MHDIHVLTRRHDSIPFAVLQKKIIDDQFKELTKLYKAVHARLAPHGFCQRQPLNNPNKRLRKGAAEQAAL